MCALEPMVGDDNDSVYDSTIKWEDLSKQIGNILLNK